MPDLLPAELEDDYYAVLALPPTADLYGIQNAYARLANDLAGRLSDDPTAKDGMLRLNEAYGVLTKPELRRRYDAIYLREEKDAEVREVISADRRGRWKANAMLGALAMIVAAQVFVAVVLARDNIASAFASLFGSGGS